MRSALIALLILIVVAVGGFALWQASDDEDDNTSTTNTTTQTTPTQTDAETQTDTEEHDEHANAVEIDNFAYTPATITVKKGETITWTNKDSVAHTVTSDDENGPLGSGDIAPGESFTFTFDTAGTFPYHCEPHPQMKGTVTVTE